MSNGLGRPSSQTDLLTTDPIITKARKREPFTWIYFHSIDNGRCIKIGHSTQSRGKRASQHAQSKNGITFELEELAEVRGLPADEKAIHRYFKQYNLGLAGEKELFEPAKELIDYIRWLRDQWYVITPEVQDIERDTMPLRSFDEWGPNEFRRKVRPVDLLPGFHGTFDFGEREITGDDFYTNKIVIDCARKLMGRIDVDPASHAVANKVVQADTFYTVTDNGLTKQWNGKVWINPPFSQWKVWVPKILNEWNSGRIEEMCVLSAMRTVTAQYFAALLQQCDAAIIFKGRIKFWGGKAGDSPDDGHSVFYFGEHRERFKEEFEKLGTVFYSSKEGT